MTHSLLSALRTYIDARIEEEFACREDDADGYRSFRHHERKLREAAWEDVLKEANAAATPPAPSGQPAAAN